MKKSIILLILTMNLFLSSHAQDNKPEANSFGLQYGVNFNGTVGQAVQFSGWLKNGLEIRGSLTFAYINTQSTTLNSGYAINVPGSNEQLPAIETTSSSSASLTVTPTISVVKHFPIKSNLDFFVGGSANAGFTTSTAWTKYANTETADSFYNSTSTKNPLTINWGLSLVGGANYFFYKNLAIGADFGVGFSASNGNGTANEQEVEVNSGAYNTNTENYNYNSNNKVTNKRYSATLTGNAGLHLTYYLKVKNHNKAAQKI
jgi:hypothetical protein